ncbi:MAG: glycosyltransferase family 4 protein [Tannerella sp.]|jgi:glycosyltransferase involved in cell wall biosynthesis|nr:glycosyltransferase family 4 protein [Tannerella sp.]
MKKVLYICSEAAPGMIPYAAGIIIAASLSKKLDVYAVTVDDGRLSYRQYLTSDKVVFLTAPSGRIARIINKIYPYRLYRAVKKTCRQQQIDCIHLLTGDFTCCRIIPKLKTLGEVFYTVHDLEPHEQYYAGLRERLFEKWITRRTRHIINSVNNLVTNSRFQYEKLKKSFISKCIFYHSFPALINDMVLSGNDVCPEISDIDGYILFFGYIQKYKGVEYLYDAYMRNAGIRQKHKLVIAGNGVIYFPHQDNPDVIFINRYIKDEEIKMLFTKAACVVYPYISATQSGVLTIAFRFGTPVLASDIPYFSEASDPNCCLYFKSADVQNLSSKLEELLTRCDLNAMKSAQHNFFNSKLSNEVIMQSIESIY